MLEDKPDILTVEEVAAILRVTERCVYAYVKNGAHQSLPFQDGGRDTHAAAVHPQEVSS